MSKLDELRWKKFDVLDQGHVCLVDVMGDDHAICEAARVSYGAGTRSVSDDRTLIRYLMRNWHTSPFEMAELKFVVQMPIDVARQWVRHRTASINEYSTRYSEAIDAMRATPSDGWRFQSTTNKQGSGSLVDRFPDDFHPADLVEENGVQVHIDGGVTAGEWLTEAERRFHRRARDLYDERLRFGVAREQARKDLPLSNYTRWVWKIDLHNLLHFLRLRMDGHAQREIREYATIIGREIVGPLFPAVWEAFCDYRLNAMSLSALDIEAIRNAMGRSGMQDVDEGVAFAHIANKRERDECRAKLARLGILGE